VKRAGEISYFIFRCIRRNGLNAVRRRIERKSRPAPTHLRLFDFLQNRKSSKSDQDSSSSDIRLSKNVSSFRGSFNRKPAHSRLRVFLSPPDHVVKQVMCLLCRSLTYGKRARLAILIPLVASVSTV